MDGTEVKTDRGEVCRGEGATNNIAEWAGVTNGLRYLKEQRWTGDLEIYGDSQLVIRQLLGEYKVRKETLQPYHRECMAILAKWQWTATWIPREQNEECDRLSKHGLQAVSAVV
jgi:ribonuclease HI